MLSNKCRQAASILVKSKQIYSQDKHNRRLTQSHLSKFASLLTHTPTYTSNLNRKSKQSNESIFIGAYPIRMNIISVFIASKGIYSCAFVWFERSTLTFL